ncbi:MAG: DUF6020 family protein [Anaerostipes sp.]|jgi:hypothetical protein|nr:DUF6020 family protein [Anaerostipes sp.]MDD3745655.1 DUF6020 family protein [Anaerostipes sp.]
MKNRKDKRRIVLLIIFSMIMSGIQVIGRSFSKGDNWNLVFNHGRIQGQAMILWFLCTIFFFLFLFGFYKIMDFLEGKDKGKIQKEHVIGLGLFLFLCWLPFLIIMYPGSGNSDVMDQLGQYFHIDALCWTQRYVVLKNPAQSFWNNHHPVFHTLVMGSFAKIGQLLGNINIGLFLMTLMQTILMAMVLSYGICYMKSRGVHKIFLSIGVVFYAFGIINGLTVTSLCKDTLFTVFIIAGTLFLVRILEMPELLNHSKKCIIGSLIFSGILLFRNNGFYILIVAFPILLFVMKQQRKQICLIIGVPMLLFGILMPKVLFPALEIAPGNEREMYSVPLQQIARLVKEHKSSIDTKDMKLIVKVMDPKKRKSKEIVRRYHGRTADPIKNFYDLHTTKKDRNKLFQIWFKYLKRYPETYIQATINHTYEYFYYERDGFDIYYNGLFADWGWKKYRKNMKKYLGIENSARFHRQRIALRRLVYEIRVNKTTRWMINVGFYTCLFMVGLWYAVIKKRKNLLISFVLLSTNLAISFLGPLVYIRYSYCYIVSLPLLFGLATINYDKNTKK